MPPRIVRGRRPINNELARIRTRELKRGRVAGNSERSLQSALDRAVQFVKGLFQMVVLTPVLWVALLFGLLGAKWAWRFFVEWWDKI